MLNLKHLEPKKLLLIGASTGGPGQIEKIISALPELSHTSIIIAQHMAVGFLPSFTKRLQEHSKNRLILAQNKTPIQSGHIYVCSARTTLSKNNTGFFFTHEPLLEHSFNPDINLLLHSISQWSGSFKILCALLTGIGNDGVDGCKKLQEKGCKCLTQTHESAVVDGMPSRARAEVPNIYVQNMNEILETTKEFCK
jgi:two-component system chemotaxis response regulator CheB